MESMLDSDAKSLADYCTKTGQSYGSFNQILSKMKKEVGEYQSECIRALETWERVKEHFAMNRAKLSGQIQNLKEEVLNNYDFDPSKETVEQYNSRLLQQIKELQNRLIQEEEMKLTPEEPSQDVDEFFDTIKFIN